MIQNMWKQDEEVQEPKPLTRIVVVAAGIAVASALHYFTSPSLILWHNLFQRLYYLPIIYAAIYFGWRGVDDRKVVQPLEKVMPEDEAGRREIVECRGRGDAGSHHHQTRKWFGLAH